MDSGDSHIFIRRAVRADAGLIHSFVRALADYERLADAVTATPEQLSATLFGERPAAEVILAYVDEAPVGFALFFQNYSTFLARPGLYLEDLFVTPEYRGKGAGRAMLQWLAHLAIERGYGRMEWAVLDWNEPALGFYYALGAQPMDDWTVFRLTGEELHHLARGEAGR